MKKYLPIIKTSLALLVFAIGVSYVFAAFPAPTSAPATTIPPVHTGADQVKQGDLSVQTFAAANSVAFNGGPTSVWFEKSIRGVNPTDPTVPLLDSTVRFGGTSRNGTYNTSIVANGNIGTTYGFTASSLQNTLSSNLCADATGKIVTCVPNTDQPLSVSAVDTYEVPVPRNIIYAPPFFSAPDGNTPTPIDVANTYNVKQGGLTVDTFISSLGAWFKDEVNIAGGIIAAPLTNPTPNIYFGDATGGPVSIYNYGTIASHTLQAKNLVNTSMRHVCADSGGAFVLCATEPPPGCPNGQIFNSEGVCVVEIKGVVTVTHDTTYSLWPRNIPNTTWLGTGYAVAIKIISVGGVATNTWPGSDITFNFGVCRSSNPNYGGIGLMNSPVCYKFPQNYVGAANLPYPLGMQGPNFFPQDAPNTIGGFQYNTAIVPSNGASANFYNTHTPYMPQGYMVMANILPANTTSNSDINHYGWNPVFQQVDVWNVVPPAGYALTLEPTGKIYRGDFGYQNISGYGMRPKNINSVTEIGTVQVKQY